VSDAADRIERVGHADRAQARTRWRGALYAVGGAVVGVLFNECLWPMLIRPDEETRAAYEAVGQALNVGRPFASVPARQRELFLEHSEWTEDDVRRMDQVIEARHAVRNDWLAARLRQRRAEDPDGPVGLSYSRHDMPESLRSLIASCTRAGIHLHEFHADKAKDMLHAVELPTD